MAPESKIVSKARADPDHVVRFATVLIENRVASEVAIIDIGRFHVARERRLHAGIGNDELDLNRLTHFEPTFRLFIKYSKQ